MTNIRYACDFRQPPQPQSKSLLANKISKEEKSETWTSYEKVSKKGSKNGLLGITGRFNRGSIRIRRV